MLCIIQRLQTVITIAYDTSHGLKLHLMLRRSGLKSYRFHRVKVEIQIWDFNAGMIIRAFPLVRSKILGPEGPQIV
jgi:hypothetical protein